ncbi:MAG: succinate dehydrogenase assembly factor 2 [Gammaproteobacteria bacterium]|nr:MAG: succinate dehydrogenase assembly factor 2 [Gammaproteobacteria bacterium]
MLELDLLLNNFVDQNFKTLSQQHRQSFELLLSYPDQTLLDLLLGNSVSSDAEIANVVGLIRATPFN